MANWSPDAIKLLEARYLRKNEVLECIETPDAMLNRVATAVSDPETTSDREAWKYKFYKSMNNLDFLPNSPCLMNAGSDNQQLLACFLLEIPDSIEGIFDMVKLTALIHKSGGGTGLSFSRLRGRHTAVTSSGGYACFAAGTYVLTTRGLVEIQDITPNEDYSISPDGSEHLITHLHQNGIQDVYEITFSDGRSIAATISHRFYGFTDSGVLEQEEIGRMVARGIIPVSSLTDCGGNKTKGITTVSFESHRNVTNKRIVLDLNTDIAWLIGLVDGDGCISRSTRRNKISITCDFKKPRVVEKAIAICASNGITPTVYHRPLLGRTDIVISSTSIVDALDSVGLLKDRSSNCTPPKLIMRSPIEVRLAYVAGFFDADGTASGGRITFKTVSKKMAHDLLLILNSVGIPTTLRQHLPCNGNKMSYRVEVIGSFGRERFIKGVGKFIVKTNLSYTLTRGRGRSIGLTINALKTLISDPSERAELSKYVMPYNAKYTSRGSLERLYSECKNSDDKSAISSALNLYSNPIAEIRYIGPCPVYDITVSDVHRYIANGMLVSNSGPVSFMRAFGVATDVVAQGGRRRGANLGLLDIGHPNIMSFISCKESTEDFSSFNISASVTDEFMDCLRKGSQFTLVDPKSVSETQIDPQEIWDALIYQAWLTGEPGVFFVDTANRYNTVPWVGDIVGTNPCGESPLRNFESCDLGSINITNFVDVKNRTFDYPRLAEVVETSIRFLDNMITVNDFTDPRISDTTKQTRKVGLGIMGWADALLMLGVPYDTQPARCLAYELAGFMMSVAERTSQALAVEKGPAPCYRRRKNKFRNATVMSIAPTGSISILANCSNSIEPIFSREYTRKVLDGDLVMSKKYTSASVRTALEISPLNHLKMQKAFQCWVDLACSKTINLPESATVGDVANVYKLAYEMQLKGVTVYRQGSRKDAPIKCDSGVCPL